MNMHSPTVAARGTDDWFPALPDKLEKAWATFDFNASEASAELQELASQVEVEGFSIDWDSSVVTEKQWFAPGTVFVTLRYALSSDQSEEMADSYPITICYRVDDDAVTITGCEADVSSFYE